MNKFALKQILLITDGCSNTGVSPIEAAQIAREEGCIINVIGVVDRGELGEYGSQEIREIAVAGGGISRTVQTKELAQTVQMLTYQAMTHTIHQAVNKELRQLLQGKTLEQLPPVERSEIVEAVERWNEESGLRLVVMIDTSLSMKTKLSAVCEAIHDLSLSLQARRGYSAMSVFTFPGERDVVHMELDWTDQPAQLQSLMHRFKPKGTTPTGPAIMKAIDWMDSGRGPGKDVSLEKQQAEKGWMEEYVF